MSEADNKNNKNDKFDIVKATEEARCKFIGAHPMFNIRMGSGSFGDKPTLMVEVTGGSYSEMFDLAESIGVLVVEHVRRNLENKNV